VSAIDALAMAKALEDALDDLPEYDCVDEKWMDVNLDNVEFLDNPQATDTAEYFEKSKIDNAQMQSTGAGLFAFFSGDSKVKLCEFIDFCIAGAFIIG
jgi:hypothetical protein